jgi:F0F1-type ATP synthase assembly protein I
MAQKNNPGWIRHAGAGVELAGATAGLALFGYWIDRKFGTGPWALIVGVVMGLVGGLYNLVKQSMIAVREAQEEDRTRAESAANEQDGV